MDTRNLRIITVLPVSNSIERCWSVLLYSAEEALDFCDQLDARGLEVGRDYTYDWVRTPNEVLRFLREEEKRERIDV